MFLSHSSSYFNTFNYFVGGRDVIDPSSVEAPVEVKKVRDMTVDVTVTVTVDVTEIWKWW